MIDEPGSFYICTETSPRCYIIQKVSAKHVDQVVNDLKWLESGGDPGSYGEPTALAPHAGRCASPPPLPVLPWWFTNECERDLEKVDEFGFDDDMNYIRVEESEMIPVISSSECQLNLNACSPLEIQVIDGHPELSHSTGASSGSPELSNLTSQMDSVILSNGITTTFSRNSVVGLSPRSPEELKSLLKAQLEYYFSRENLITDRYLRSQMDNDQYVPIRTIASFPKVIALTSDPDLIVEALRGSPNVQVDEKGEKVRPAIKRQVIILRDIPESTKLAEVEALFTNSRCPPFVSIVYGSNNCWYITFECEESTQKAFLYLQTEVKSFKGKPIFARIKAGKAPGVLPNASTPSPQTSVQEVCTSTTNGVLPADQNGYRRVPPPNSLPIATSPGLVVSSPSQTIQTQTPVSLVSPANESTQLCASPEINYTNTGQTYMTWTPSPSGTPGAQIVTISPWIPQNFDLGYILQANGYQARGVHRPPATLLHVPPGAMANSLQAAANSNRSSPPASYRPNPVVNGGHYPGQNRYNKVGRGRGGGGGNYHHYHNQSYINDKNSPSSSEQHSHGRSNRGHNSYGPRRPNAFNRQGQHYGRNNNFHDEGPSNDREYGFKGYGGRRHDRDIRDQDIQHSHYDKIRGRPSQNRRFPGARTEYSGPYPHNASGFNEGRRTSAINEESPESEGQNLRHEDDGFFDATDPNSFPSLPTTKSDEAPKMTSPSERRESAPGELVVSAKKQTKHSSVTETDQSPNERVQKQVPTNSNEYTKINRTSTETDQKPITPSFSSVAAGMGSSHGSNLSTNKDEIKVKQSSSACSKTPDEPVACVNSLEPPKRLSYAQMAQKKNSSGSRQATSESGSVSSEGGRTPPPANTHASTKSNADDQGEKESSSSR